MKGTSVIVKNLKLLFRSKETAFTILFGPLLIILVVSAAYTGGQGKEAIAVGTYAPSYTPLVNEMISSLKEKGYHVSVFANESDCVDRIKTGEIHTCVFFPDDFRVVENETRTVRFVVDYSRINLVHAIIDGLSKEFEMQSTALSEAMASDVLQRLRLAQGEISAQLENSAELEQRLERVREETSAGQTRLTGVDMNVSFTNLKDIRGRVNGLATIITDLKTTSLEAIDEAKDALLALRSDVENETRDQVDETIVVLRNKSDEIRAISDTAPDAVEKVSELIDEAAQAILKAQESHQALVNASIDVEKRLATADAELSSSLAILTTIRGKLAHVDQSLRKVLGVGAGNLAAPITTEIEALTTEDEKLAFTYPYILMLVIMFLGLMINSSLIVMDKTSTAAFRNFTTATRDEYHILFSFFTTFLILLVQTLAILVVSFFFVKTPLFNNFGVSLVVIFFAITLFSFLGMIVGYLSGTQEAAMIASLSVGSILLFISNLVLPLESMNKLVKVLSWYNPYVVLSELLKQSMLFHVGLGYMAGKIGLLVLTSALLFGLILIIQRSVKAKFFQQRAKDLEKAAFARKEVKPLRIGDREVRDLFELWEIFDAMTRGEFEQLSRGNGGISSIVQWVRDELGEKRLARKLRCNNKERIILALDKFLKKETKRLQKKQ